MYIVARILLFRQKPSDDASQGRVCVCVGGRAMWWRRSITDDADHGPERSSRQEQKAKAFAHLPGEWHHLWEPPPNTCPRQSIHTRRSPR